MRIPRGLSVVLPSLFVAALSACASLSAGPPIEIPSEASAEVSVETAAETPAARPVRPQVPERILGDGQLEADSLASFLLAANPAAGTERVRELADLYLEEARLEGVNGDIAFAQMCLETGFLKFGGLVTPDMHNYCGLGSIGPEAPGERFPSARLGVRAHVQHLQGYASEKPLAQTLADPRYRWIRRGSAPTISDLAGRWATDPEYGNKIRGLVERLYAHALIAPRSQEHQGAGMHPGDSRLVQTLFQLRVFRAGIE